MRWGVGYFISSKPAAGIPEGYFLVKLQIECTGSPANPFRKLAIGGGEITYEHHITPGWATPNYSHRKLSRTVFFSLRLHKL